MAVGPHGHGRTVMIAFGAWLVVVVAGILLATVGTLLREPLCVGGGSECVGAQAPSSGIGNVVFYVGTAIAVASPLIAAAVVALWRRPARDVPHRRDRPIVGA